METPDLRQVTDVLPNMHTCIQVCSGWRHEIINTVLLSHLQTRTRWKEGSQFQIGSGLAATQTSNLSLGRPVTLPLDQGGRCPCD